MATILSKDLKVKNGQIIKVKNENRKDFSNEAQFYYAVWIKYVTGEEFCIMFTENEFKRCEKILGTLTYALDLGQVYTYASNKNEVVKVLIKLIHSNGDETCVFFPIKMFEKLKNRADKNIEDQPEKSWWVDLLD